MPSMNMSRKPRKPAKAELLALAEVIAGLTKDGEMIEIIEGDSVEFEMTADDAFDTLHSLISQARALLGLPDRYQN